MMSSYRAIPAYVSSSWIAATVRRDSRFVRNGGHSSLAIIVFIIIIRCENGDLRYFV